MSDELVKTESTWALIKPESAKIMARLQREIQCGQMTKFDLEQVRVPAGGGLQWDLGDRTASTFNGVIVSIEEQRAYYSRGLDESDETGPPDCSSDDLKYGIGNPGGECKVCPHAQWHSAPHGEGQACKQSRWLMVMITGSLMPLCLKVPPTSLKACKHHVLHWLGRGIPHEGMVTRFGLDRQKGPPAYSTITFNLVREVTPEESADLERLAEIFRKAQSPSNWAREPGEED